jgi:hypothetical protein
MGRGIEVPLSEDQDILDFFLLAVLGVELVLAR